MSDRVNIYESPCRKCPVTGCMIRSSCPKLEEYQRAASASRDEPRQGIDTSDDTGYRIIP